MTQERLVLVTGSTGSLGPSVVRAFSNAGYRVRTLAPSHIGPGLLPGNADIRIGDVTNQETVRNAVAGCDVVVHLAARLHIVDPLPALRQEYERTNVGGTAAVVHASIAGGVTRVVYFSTVATYGPATGEALTEDVLPRPDTLYGQTKLEGEKLILAARRPDGQAIGTALRFGAVYGPRLKGNYLRPAPRFERPALRYTRSRRQPQAAHLRRGRGSRCGPGGRAFGGRR